MKTKRAANWKESLTATGATALNHLIRVAKARRAGRVGCNILLDKIPLDAGIPIVHAAKFLTPKSVRDAYLRVRPFAKLSVKKRGWTLDVLNAVASLKRKEFSLTEAYLLELGTVETSSRQSQRPPQNPSTAPSPP